MSLPYLPTVQPSTSNAPSRSADTALRGRWLILARIVWGAMAVLLVGLFVASIPADYNQKLPLFATPQVQANLSDLGLSFAAYATCYLILTGTFTLGFCIIGAILFWRKSDDWMALFVAFLLVLIGTQFPNTTLALVAQHPIWDWLVTFVDLLTLPSFVLFFCLFPDGHFVPRWTRWLAVSGIAVQLTVTFFPELNPFTAAPVIAIPFTFGLFGTMLSAQVYRYRRVSDPVQRQQTKWVVFGAALALIGLFAAIALDVSVPWYNEPGSLSSLINTAFLYAAFLLIPLTVGIAVLRYRLWDIDPLINRTLVYGTLTSCVIGIYVLVVGYFGAFFQVRNNHFVSLLAAAIVAVLFQPLRERLQRAVNRLMYGRRDEPYAVISQLGQRLEATLAPDAVLPAIVQTVRDALKLPYAAIALPSNDQPTATNDQRFALAAASGTPISDPLRLPRSPGEPFSSADRQLLDDLARQAGVAVHAVRLTRDVQRANDELQRARIDLVTAREEERRRLRHDLHDGLGSVLASLNLRAGAIRALITRDPAAADALAVEQQTTIRSAIADMRRLVHHLRPPALDELGLVAALREQAAQLSAAHPSTAGRDGDNRLQIDVMTSEMVPLLPAAVEVAAYRIVQEALTNVVRHAHAQRCAVRLAVQDHVLEVEINDDGVGLPDRYRAGVGVLSMRERAEELGGTCTVERALGGGTRVLARLPVGRLTNDEHPLPNQA